MIEAYKRAYNSCEINEQATCYSVIFLPTRQSDSYEPGLALIFHCPKNQPFLHNFLVFFPILYRIIKPYIDPYIDKRPNDEKMATESTATTKIILSRSEDWEKWFRQLRGHVDKDIWAFLDPDVNEEDEEEPMEKPVKPSLRDYNHNAITFANLSQAQQKAYEAARGFYNHDLREYNRQQDLLREARSYIQSTVSIAKQTHLDPSKTEREWILALRDDTAPPDGYMLDKMRERYTNLLKAFKSNKIHPWLDEWEVIMLDCIKYDLPEIQRGLWLKDLARLFKPISEFCYEQFRKDATDEDKSDPTHFRTVARELREKYEQQKGGRTMRGSAFPATFGDDEDEHQASEDEKPSQKGRKRPGSQQDEKGSKKPATQCSGCELKGHKLRDCWYIFEDLKPEGRRLSAQRSNKVKKALTDNEALKKEVEKLRTEMKKEA